MHVAISGSTGLVGSELVPLLETGGHRITRLVRREATEGEARWEPDGEFDTTAIEGVDGVVHLAGENIAGSRWSDKVKQKIRDSRVDGTRLLCEGLAHMQHKPKVLVCASAIGIYGDRGDEILDEHAPVGDGFLAEVAAAWEEATQAARDAGIRVVQTRFGIILSPHDGALAKMLLPFRMGAGGIVGSGDQYWSWISLDDVAAVLEYALVTESLSGPVNVVSPNPVTNREFTKTLGRVLNRPTVIPLPAFAARLALGEMADALLLASTRVVPGALENHDYHFQHPELETALRHLLQRNG